MGKFLKEKLVRREIREERVNEMITEGQRRRLERLDRNVEDSRNHVVPIQKETHRAVEKTALKLKKGVTSAQIANACSGKLPAAICSVIAFIKDPEAALEFALRAFRENKVIGTYTTHSRSGIPRVETISYKANGRNILRDAGILE